MANIDRRTFDSASDAFSAFDADTAPFARLATQKLKHLGTAISTLDKWTRKGGYFKPICGATADSLMCGLLLNGDVANLSDKSWKCVKPKNSNDVWFYSDSYHLHIDRAVKLEAACQNVGLNVRIFEWTYPRREFDQDGRWPSTSARIIGGGYRQLYRGKLVGFALGAYENPHDPATTKKKRPRE